MRTLVIGANGAIGRACVIELQKSVKVIAADVTLPKFDAASNRTLDVRDAKAVTGLIQSLDEDDPITGMIYAAGLNTTGPLDAVDWEDYEKVMAVNLRGAFHVGAALLAVLRRKPREFSSVYIASTAGLVGESGGSVYCASKFGLIGFTQSFAGEIAEFGGRANAVCPGNVDSPMLKVLATSIGARSGKSGDATLEEWKSASGFKRLIKPEEVAQTCSWLISRSSSGISGQTIVVDGPKA
ncbi:MAG: SDR family NAD(P)-dependent oxidoreductase [Actinomycetota bacterium]